MQLWQFVKVSRIYPYHTLVVKKERIRSAPNARFTISSVGTVAPSFLPVGVLPCQQILEPKSHWEHKSASLRAIQTWKTQKEHVTKRPSIVRNIVIDGPQRSTIVFWWLSTLLLDWIACFQFATHFIFVFELEVCYRLHALNFDKKMWAACVPPWMKFEGWLSLINSQLLNDVEWWPIFKPPESSVAKLSSFLEADDRDSVYGLRIKKSCYRPSLLRVWDSATPLTTYACGFLKLPKLVSEISRQHVYHCDGDIQNMWENPETPRFTAMTADMLKMHMHENALNDAHGSEIKTALFLPETIVYHRFLVKRIMSYIPATSFSSCRIRW